MQYIEFYTLLYVPSLISFLFHPLSLESFHQRAHSQISFIHLKFIRIEYLKKNNHKFQLNVILNGKMGISIGCCLCCSVQCKILLQSSEHGIKHVARELDLFLSNVIWFGCWYFKMVDNIKTNSAKFSCQAECLKKTTHFKVMHV